jgi:DNA-binding transcriptional LysR family regulator
MDIRQLRQFVAIAHNGSLVSAARAIGIAQPPLSASMRKLEQELGLKLFERLPRGVVLTPAGKELLGPAQDVVNRMAGIRSLMGDIKDGVRGTLRLGYVDTAAFSLLPRLIKALRAAHPLIDLQLHEMTTNQSMQGVLDGTLDAGIIRTPLLQMTSLRLLLAEEDRMVLMIPFGHHLQKEANVRLEDLASERFVMYDGDAVPNLRAVAIIACQKAGFMPNIVQEATHVHSLASLVEGGIGVGLVPAKVARWTRAENRFREVTVEGQPIAIALAIATPAERVTRASQWLCEAVDSLDEDIPL